MIKYPHDLVSFVRQKTFSIESRLVAKEEGEESPRQLLKGFSVFKFVCIANGKAVSANLKPNENFVEVKSNTKFASEKHKEYAFECANSKNAGHNSPAFVERFNAGFLKGKTPIDVLLENGYEKGKEILNQQYTFLKESATKNPKFAAANNRLMNAIVDAAKVDLDSLKNVSLPVAPAPIKIFESGAKGSMKSKAREDGKYACYDMSIYWDVSRDYPVVVTISNYYAPIRPTENGGQNIILSEKDSETKNDFALTAAEWEFAVEEMEDDLKTFKQFHYKEGRTRAERADAENRRAASSTAT